MNGTHSEKDDSFCEHLTCKRRFMALGLATIGVWIFWSKYGTYGLGITIGTLLSLLGLLVGASTTLAGVVLRLFFIIISVLSTLTPEFLKLDCFKAAYQIISGGVFGISSLLSGLASVFSSLV